MEATVDGVTSHVTEEVTSCWVPSEKTPVALSCRVEPVGIDLFAGAIVICASFPVTLVSGVPLVPQLSSSAQDMSTQAKPATRRTEGNFIAEPDRFREGEGLTGNTRTLRLNDRGRAMPPQLSLCASQHGLRHMD
jgi:hypothetical protein